MAVYGGPEITTDGLVLCLDAGNTGSYPGSGTAWNDLSGSGNNGTLTNGPTYSSSNGGSIVFDGSNDHVVFSNTSSLQFLNRSPYTLECWFNLGAIPSVSTYPGLFHREATVEGGRNGYALIVACNTVNKLQLGTERHTPSGTIYVFTGEVDSSPLVGVWKHLCGTYDGTTLSLYLDSQFVTSQTQTTNITNTTTALNIGRLYGSYFNGRISCPRIYNRGLSAAEVAQNYAAIRGRFGL
jgi:hypothetical protein